MSTPAHPKGTNPLHQYRRSGPTVNHSKEKALSDRHFELLLEGARELAREPYYYAPDPPFVVYVLGRLGLRRGELAHLEESWIDYRNKMINIPAREPCTRGQDGGVCGNCKILAEQRVAHADDLTIDEALEHVWTPKTEAGVRSVYYGFDTRAEIFIERYFSSPEYNRFEVSGTAIRRRVDRAAEKAKELTPDDVMPHGLRATAATRMAGKGLGIYQMCQFFGWVKTTTAENYVSRNSVNTAKALDGLDSR